MLFAEGTTSDGLRVMPFKSALFAAARAGDDGVAVTIQPVSIAYTGLDGMPLGRSLKPLVAWYGDMSMGAHAFALLGLGRITIEVLFHPVVSYESFASRKALSGPLPVGRAAGVSTANAGRGGDGRCGRGRAGAGFLTRPRPVLASSSRGAARHWGLRPWQSGSSLRVMDAR